MFYFFYQWIVVTNNLKQSHPQCMESSKMYYLTIFFSTWGVIALTKQSVHTSVRPFLNRYLSKTRYPVGTAEREDRMDKISDHMAKLFIYLALYTLLTYIIGDSNFFHWTLGGKVDRIELFDNYPC